LPQAGFISEAEHLSRDTSRDTFVPRGERAASEGRLLHAALHFRRAEFFMMPSDPVQTATVHPRDMFGRVDRTFFCSPARTIMMCHFCN
jgi:hypothetical protein